MSDIMPLYVVLSSERSPFIAKRNDDDSYTKIAQVFDLENAKEIARLANMGAAAEAIAHMAEDAAVSAESDLSPFRLKGSHFAPPISEVP